MAKRNPACDPCRLSKLSCDHAQPVCSRCRERNQAQACHYRERPFKKRKQQQSPQIHAFSSVPSTVPQPRTVATPHKYPNPGYLGSSSLATIYDDLPSGNDQNNAENIGSPFEAFHAGNTSYDAADISDGAQFIENVRNSVKISDCRKLVDEWLQEGVNLALAGIVTRQCAHAAESVLTLPSQQQPTPLQISGNLFGNSCRPLNANAADVIEWSSQFCSHNARWETLCLFFIALTRATIDMPWFYPIYKSTDQRRSFQKLAARFADRCLEIALSLDCLNDLQLMLQYENWIMHSFVDGDQSYHSWRRLGDVISSLYALGYHERIESQAMVSPFVKDLRRSALGRVYSADKNMSIFLGRPVRIPRKHSRFQIPGVDSASLQQDVFESLKHMDWEQYQGFTYSVDTTWAAICALLKEEVLDFTPDMNMDEQLQKTQTIQAYAEAYWNGLPSHLRLDGPLKLRDNEPFARDLIVSMRLNYLHVLFMLQRALVRRIPEHNAQMGMIAADMLGLTAEAVILKSQLANSGTSLIWKVAYYGLPAAGIVCIFLLQGSSSRSNFKFQSSKVFQDLSVLVAEVETGALIGVDSPNYALLAGATRTIKNILDRVWSGQVSQSQPTQPETNSVEPKPAETREPDWTALTNDELRDFDIDFWLNLADHPALNELDNAPF